MIAFLVAYYHQQYICMYVCTYIKAKKKKNENNCKTCMHNAKVPTSGAFSAATHPMRRYI